MRTKGFLPSVRTSLIGKWLDFFVQALLLDPPCSSSGLRSTIRANPKFRQIFPEYSEPNMRDPPNMGQKERGIADDPPQPAARTVPSTRSPDSVPAPVPGSTPLAILGQNAAHGVASTTNGSSSSTMTTTPPVQPPLRRAGQGGRPWLLLAGMAVVVSAVFLKIAG
jgi:hypothetical protein